VLVPPRCLPQGNDHPLVQSKIKLLSYDGCAEFQAQDAASFFKFMDNIYNSKELIGRIRKHSRIMLQNTHLLILQNAGCGERFVDLETENDIMVGYDNLIFGKRIESSGGLDGILRTDSHLNLGGGKNCE
jgi:hypothetical protein